MLQRFFTALLKLSIGLFALNVIAVALFIFRSHAVDLPTMRDDVKSSAAVVFFGHPAETLRLQTALALHDDDHVQNIIFIGGCRPQKNYFGSADLRRIAADHGVPEAHLHIGLGSFDTIGNLDALALVTAREEFRSLTLVSSKPHLLRIRRALRNRLPSDLNIFYAPTPDEGVLSIIWQHQHEVIQALATALLPDDFYRSALRRRRLGPGSFNEAGLCEALTGL